MDKLIAQIRDICHSISKGNYDYVKQLEELTIQGEHPKEIAELAESFSVMLLKLEAHEYHLEKAMERLKQKNISLKKEIDTLKIDINKIEKSSAVEQITQSKFFKEIHQKTKQHRKK